VGLLGFVVAPCFVGHRIRQDEDGERLFAAWRQHVAFTRSRRLPREAQTGDERVALPLKRCDDFLGAVRRTVVAARNGDRQHGDNEDVTHRAHCESPRQLPSRGPGGEPNARALATPPGPG
jgi:hypothetical protein